MLLDTPQPLLLATTRLQVDKFPRGTVGDARRSLNGALDVRAAKKRSPAFRALWRRRRRSLGADARAGEARRAVDDYVVAHARGLRDAAAAAAALPYAAWLGLPQACAVLAAMAPEGLRPARDGLRRSPLHVAAARGHADAYAVLLKAARRAGVRGAARTPDALGGKPRDYVAVAPNCSEVFPGTDAEAAAALERSALVGAPVLLRGAALGWNWTGWDWSALERRDDVVAAPRHIPHGDSFGLASTQYDDPRRLRARSRRHVRLRRGRRRRRVVRHGRRAPPRRGARAAVANAGRAARRISSAAPRARTRQERPGLRRARGRGRARACAEIIAST